VNTASGRLATVGGGEGNVAADVASTVAGGGGNTASGQGATVGGGLSNIAANGTTIGGGQSNFADGAHVTVGGGEGHSARGAAATVGGGTGNSAGGQNATIPGGLFNSVAGDFSFAAGRRAKADHAGSFVWADPSTALINFASEADNQFRVRSTGGAQFVSGIDLRTGVPTAGVTLAAGGNSWAGISDRNLKDNITPLDGRDILRRLSVIPITQWNLKAQDPAIKHLGPMAQDFYAAFGLGENERYINSADADGIALVSIQARYEIVTALEQKAAAVERLAQIIEELRVRMTRFEQAAKAHR
jgi:trimeric autotransporter adhesin